MPVRSINPIFNTLCGFEESEVQAALSDIVQSCKLAESEMIDALDTMRTWYNGYQFSATGKELVYNPTLALYFMKAFQQTCTHPDQLLVWNDFSNCCCRNRPCVTKAV